MSAPDRLARLGPVFRSRDAIASGIIWRDLYALRDTGEIVQLSRGLYQKADSVGADSIDFVSVCGRAPDGTICLDSAMAYWDLTDAIPRSVDLAGVSGVTRS